MKWFSWVILVLGVWILISPWALTFADYTPARWSNIIVGIFIILLTLWQLFGGNSSTPTVPK